MRLPLRLLVWTALAPLALLGCSSNDDEGGDSNPGAGDGDGGDGGSGEPGPVLFFTGSLKAVDPRDPSTVFTIRDEEIDRSLVASVVEGDFAPNGGAAGTPELRGFEALELVFAEGDTLVRVEAEAIEGEAPMEVELVQLPDEVVSLTSAPDVVDPERTQLLVELADGTHHAVLLDGTVRELPGEPIEFLVDQANGSLLGHLVHDDASGDLILVGAAGTETPLGTFGDVRRLADSTAGGLFLVCDGVLRFLDLGAPSLTNLGIGLLGIDELEYASDGTDLLLLVRGDDVVTLERIRPNAARFLLFQATDAVSPAEGLDLGVSGGRAVIRYDAQPLQGSSPDFGRLVSVSLDGSDALLLATRSDNTLIGADAVYYEEPVAQGPIFVAVDSTGTERFREAGGRIAGYTVAGLSLGGTDVASVVFVRGYDPFVTGAAGKPLLALDLEANTLTDLGTVPSDALVLFLAPTGGNGVLAAAAISAPAPQGQPPADVFYLDVETPGSLRRVTTTPDVSEVPLPLLFGG